MSDLTLSERLETLVRIVFSSPFFITLFAFIIITIIVFCIHNATDNKLSRIISTLAYIMILAAIIIKYGKLIFSLFDSLIDQIFMAIYFPNLITYICMIVITSLLMIATIISKKLKGFIRICNVLSFLTIMFLFILTIDIISKSNIDILQKTSLYSNETLMILIQASMAIFVVWVSSLIINLVIRLLNFKIEGKDTILEVKLQENEELEFFTEDDYYKGFISYNKKKKYQEYMDINKH